MRMILKVTCVVARSGRALGVSHASERAVLAHPFVVWSPFYIFTTAYLAFAHGARIRCLVVQTQSPK